MIVLDASALIGVLLREPDASALGERILHAGTPLHAPHLIDIEIAHVLRRLAMRGGIDDQRAGEALADLADLPIWRHPHGVLMPAVWRLRHNVTAYDAVYVALADALGAKLVTRDARLAKAAGHLVAMKLV